MILLERLKSLSLPNGNDGKILERRRFFSALKNAVGERWILFVFLILFMVPFSILKTLSEDGSEVFASQKDALVLEVFARTDLEPDAYPLLEESLRVLTGVKEVIAVSPQDSLKKVAGDPKIGIDTSWLMKKSQDLKDTILPWSYDLHLARWDEEALKGVIQKIEGLQVGRNKIIGVSEIHYDKERWSLAFALYNYVRWIKRSLAFLLFLSFSMLIFLAVKLRNRVRNESRILSEGVRFLSLGLAGGILSHGVYLVILSLTFFPETFNWRDQIGHGLIFQTTLSLVVSLSLFGVWALGKKI